MTRKVCLFLYGLTQGGVPRRTVSLARALADAGEQVELVTVAGGNRAEPLGSAVRHTSLAPWLASIPWVRGTRRRQFFLAGPLFARHLGREKPDVIIAADTYANLCAVAARRAGAPRTALILTQRKHASTYAAKKPALIERMRRRYVEADAIVGVSEGVARDLVDIGLPADRVRAIYNPVITDQTQARCALPAAHPWLMPPNAVPVIVAAGRLTPQKDFPTLIRAFARLRAAGLPYRLLILGGGPAAMRDALLREAGTLGVAEYLHLPGHVAPIEPYLSRAALFVLSSRFEGLPGVLIEALACGAPVVSTDCPSGPREILLDGRLGPLVPVGDEAALAAAMIETLRAPGDAGLRRSRAEDFSMHRACAAYRSLMDSLVPSPLGTRPARAGIGP